MKVLLTLLLTIASFTAFAQEMTQQQIEAKYNLPKAPNPKFQDVTVYGIDSNENGIRDEIERAITFRFYNNSFDLTHLLELSMLMSTSMAQTMDFNYKAIDPKKVIANSNKIVKQTICYVREGGLEAANNVEVLTRMQVNTYERQVSYNVVKNFANIKEDQIKCD